LEEITNQNKRLAEQLIDLEKGIEQMKEFKAKNRSKPMEGSLKPADHFKKHNDPEVNQLLSKMKEVRAETEHMN